MSHKTRTEFWESAFKTNQEVWGLKPAQSAVLTTKFFVDKSLKHMLISCIGYGRNAQPFIENGLNVSGIEISRTAIGLAKTGFGSETHIFHGSVTEIYLIKCKKE